MNIGPVDVEIISLRNRQRINKKHRQNISPPSAAPCAARSVGLTKFIEKPLPKLQTLTFDVQKEVEARGAVGSDGNSHVVSADVAMQHPLSKVAAADCPGFGGCTDRHCGVDLTRGVLASASAGVRSLVHKCNRRSKNLDKRPHRRGASPNCLFVSGRASRPPPNTGFIVPTRVHITSGTAIGSAVLARLTVVELTV